MKKEVVFGFLGLAVMIRVKMKFNTRSALLTSIAAPESAWLSRCTSRIALLPQQYVWGSYVYAAVYLVETSEHGFERYIQLDHYIIVESIFGDKTRHKFVKQDLFFAICTRI